MSQKCENLIPILFIFCLVSPRFLPFTNVLQMCCETFLSPKQASKFVLDDASSIAFVCESRNCEIIHQGKTKIDRSFMLGGTCGSFERQNAWHFVSVDCHFESVLEWKRKSYWKENNAQFSYMYHVSILSSSRHF